MSQRRRVFFSLHRSHFFVFSAKIMRQILIAHARRVKADKRGGELAHVPLNAELNWVGLPDDPETLDLASAQGLFAMTLAVTVAGQDYLIESIAANEAFGQVYLYRLLLREALFDQRDGFVLRAGA